MDKIFVIMADNGQDYSDFREWPIAFVESEDEAQNFVKTVDEQIGLLFSEAQSYHWKIDYAKAFDETAAGKRYGKYLKKQGVISKSEKYVSWSRYNVRYIEVPRIIVL